MATKKQVARTHRDNALREMLAERRKQLKIEVEGKIHDARAEGSQGRGVFDSIESADVDSQGEIEFALLQMKTDTLRNIEAALHRLDDGGYGNCIDCQGEISLWRLQALPFAVRCKDCEKVREDREERES